MSLSEDESCPDQIRTYSASSNEESAVETIGDAVSGRMEELPCFHEATSRNVAEVLLLNNPDEGTFLIRSNRDSGNYSLSVRTVNSVKHFQIQYDGQCYSFGQAQFWTPDEIWTHLQNAPVLECDEGIRVQLLHPYFNENNSHSPIPEVGYGTIKRHYIPEKQTTPKTSTSSKSKPLMKRSSNITTCLEGLLHKKKEGKTWKRRWCILTRNELTYKKSEKEKKELKTLDLSEAMCVVEDRSDPNKKHCFRIVFPKKYYLFASDSAEEIDNWFKIIKWQIDACSLEET